MRVSSGLHVLRGQCQVPSPQKAYFVGEEYQACASIKFAKNHWVILNDIAVDSAHGDALHVED